MKEGDKLYRPPSERVKIWQSIDSKHQPEATAAGKGLGLLF
ncbi:hypothetical protein [Pseudoalteromonas rubra]|nr:hypothetical protein [Pseudoalteromonas rubra]